ncbi:uncharacterized protein LOC134568521 [Pelobates fuscus]|uniref:uncharacterized protein LOC134568521 n=1 Tax=Pelobates fuscus TaxID=191477 RepID=UPI002FE4CFF7
MGILLLLSLLVGALPPGVPLESLSTPTPELFTENPLVTGVTDRSAQRVKAEVENWAWSSSQPESTNASPVRSVNESEGVTEQSISVADTLTTGSMATEPDNPAVSTGAPEEVITGLVKTTSNPTQTFPNQNNMEREVTSSFNSQPTSTATPTTTPTATTRAEETAETVKSHTEMPLTTPEPPTEQSQSSSDTSTVITQGTVTTATQMAAITTNVFITSRATTASPTSPATQGTRAAHTTRSEVEEHPSVLNVGDDDRDLPGFYSKSNSNPLFVMIVSVFTIMVVMVVVIVGFHRYRRRNSRTEFRRLQDLPMDDMMEDTPLSLYSY